MKKIGIIGGLGPLAGAFFYQRLIQLSPARTDEEQLSVVLISEPAIPSRLDHLAGRGPSPVPAFHQVAADLVSLGAEMIAIPSSTANLYAAEIGNATTVPIVPLVEEVVHAIQREGCQCIGLLGTTPTLSYGLYDEAFQKSGITTVRPDQATQEEVMEIIATVKGRPTESPLSPSERILEIAMRPWADSVDGLLLACTEIPVIFPASKWKENRAKPGGKLEDEQSANRKEKGSGGDGGKNDGRKAEGGQNGRSKAEDSQRRGSKAEGSQSGGSKLGERKLFSVTDILAKATIREALRAND